MKTLKMKFFENILLAAACLFGAVSCGGLVDGVPDRPSSGSSERGIGYLSSISFGSSSRSILPSDLSLEEDIDEYVLTGELTGATSSAQAATTLEKTWETDEDSPAYTKMLAELSKSPPALEAGSWKFSINAKINGVSVLEQSVEMTVKKGNNSLNFGKLSESVGNGALNVTLSFPSDAGVKSVVAELLKPDGSTALGAQNLSIVDGNVESSSSVNYSVTPESGLYIVKFTFAIEASGQNLSQTYTELAHIATGRTSSAVRTIENLNTLYSISFNLTGGTLAAGTVVPTTYSPYQSVTLPAASALSKKGSTGFAGWYEGDPYSGNPKEEIAVNSSGNKTFSAKWGYEIDTVAKTLSSLGADIIVQSDGKETHCYFDQDGDGVADPDEIILGDDGKAFDFTGYTIYGGSQSGRTSGSTNVTVNSGSLEAIYGGNGTGSVTDSTVTVNGGSVNTVYGGSEGGTVSGNTTVNITGGYINNVYGAGDASDTNGSSVVNVTGGKIENLVAGSDEGSVKGDSTVNITGGTVTKVTGGSKDGIVTGDSVINISGGTITEVDGNKDNVTGTSSVNVSGNVNIGDKSAEKGIYLDSLDGGYITAADDVTGTIVLITEDSEKLTTGTVIVKADDDVDVTDDVTLVDTETEPHEIITDIGKGADGNYSVGQGPLSGIVINQYGTTDSESGSNPYNITSTFKPYTTDYSGLNLQTSVNYMGKIIVTPTWNETYFEGIASATLSGTLSDNADLSYGAALSDVTFDSNGGCKISVFTYSDYTEIVLKYVVNVKNSNRQVTYTFPIAISQLEGLTADTTVKVNGTDYTTVNGDYPNMLAFVIRNGNLDFVGRVNNGDMLKTTYSYQGWKYVINVDGINKELTLEDNGDSTATAVDSTSGVTLKVAVEITMSGDTPYLKLTHTINPNGHNVKLGAWTDTMVGSDDKVPIECKTWGYYLDGAIKLSLYLHDSLGVDDVDGWWYGVYNKASSNVFSKENPTAKLTGIDSGAAFHWENISGVQNITKTIRMSLSDSVD